MTDTERQRDENVIYTPYLCIVSFTELPPGADKTHSLCTLRQK